MMEEGDYQFLTKNKRYEIRFVGIKETWGKSYVEGEYELVSDEGRIPVRLKINKASLHNEKFLDYVNIVGLDIREPGPEDCQAGFIKNREDLERLFKSRGIEELIEKALIQLHVKVGQMEKIQHSGGKVSSSWYVVEFKESGKNKPDWTKEESK